MPLHSYNLEVAQDYGQPISSEIMVTYNGRNKEKAELAKNVTDKLFDIFEEKGYQIAKTSNGGMSSAGTEYYASDASGSINIHAHEEWHSYLFDQGFHTFENKKNGLDIYEEASATAVGLYAEFLATNNSSTIEMLKDFGNKVNTLYKKLQNSDNSLTPSLQEEMSNIVNAKIGVNFSGNDWIAFQNNMEYFALFGPCITILEEYGQEKGKEILEDAYDVGSEYNSIDAALFFLRKHIPEEKLEELVLADHYVPVRETGAYASVFKREGIEFVISACTPVEELVSGFIHERFDK